MGLLSWDFGQYLTWHSFRRSRMAGGDYGSTEEATSSTKRKVDSAP
jgi:hypothetical protein